MREVVPGMGDHRIEAAHQLVLALRAGIEAFQPGSNGLLDALVEAGLEVQAVELRQATPVAPVERIAVQQRERHRHRPSGPARQHHADRLWHALGQQTEEGTGQVRPLSTHVVGVGVAGVDEIPFRLAQLVAFTPVEVDALPRHLLALLAHLLALARGQRVEEVLEIPIATVVPVELAADALQPVGFGADQGVEARLREVDVGAGKPLDLQIAGNRPQQLEARRRLRHQ